MATQTSALVLALALMLNIGLAHSTSINLSTAADATLGGLTFGDADVVNYDTDTATLLFDSTGKFTDSEDIDAVHVLSNGNILFSTRSDGQFSGGNTLDFKDGDVVEYDPGNNMASIFFSEDNFDGNADISAFHVLPSGNYILSTYGEESLGGITFRDGDLVDYNPIDNVATLFLSEDLFSDDADIDAVHVLLSGNIVLSTEQDGLTLGGYTFNNGDLVEYNPIDNVTVKPVFFSEDLFSEDADIDAAHIAEVSAIPVPASIWLFGSGLLGIAGVARRHTR